MDPFRRGRSTLLIQSDFNMVCSSSQKSLCSKRVVRRPSVVNFPHVRILLRNRWTEFGVMSEDVRPGLWLVKTSSLQPLAERNSTKIDRKQELNVIYKVCGFSGQEKVKMNALASDLLRRLSASFLQPLSGIEWFDRKQRSLPSLCFWADWKTKMAALVSDWLRHFRLPLCNDCMRSRRNFEGAGSQHTCTLPSLCFRAYGKTKMVALNSDWLRHFRILLWNHWAKFDESWQKVNTQLYLPSLCFWMIVKPKKPSWSLIVCSPLQALMLKKKLLIGYG